MARAAIGSGERDAFVPVTPCRLLDTRPGTTVGPRSTPLVGGTVADFNVRGANGSCFIPADALAVQMNVTILNPTAVGYLTMWPSDASQPTASHLNWVSGQPATPNAATVKLSSLGQLRMFVNSGTVDVIIDVNGYYADHNHDDRYYTKSQIGGVFEYDTGLISLPPNTYTSGTLSCPFGTRAVGTGINLRGIFSYVSPFGTFVGYFLSNDLSITTSVSAQAVCVQGTAGSGLPIENSLTESSEDVRWATALQQLERDAAAVGLARVGG